MVGLLARSTGMTQKIRNSNVVAVLQRERLILAGFAANAGAVAMVLVHRA